MALKTGGNGRGRSERQVRNQVNHGVKRPNHLQHSVPVEALGDFTTTWRVLPISALAIIIGVISAYVAVLLLKLIGLVTNILRTAAYRTDFTRRAPSWLGRGAGSGNRWPDCGL